jgi:hypothetical protein
VGADVLSDRALGRATLARQLLLERAPLGASEAVDHLVGLQAQVPRDPYVALWSRLASFDPGDVEELLLGRELVRIVVLRGTLHLAGADDAARMRPLVQPVLDAELRRHREHRDELARVDLPGLAGEIRAYLSDPARPRTVPQLRDELAARWPAHDPAALAYACRNVLPLVQAPPRGLWSRSGQVALVDLEAWTGRPLDPSASLDDLVLRYLAAFGPASTADVAAWTRLTALREVVDRLRPQLREVRTEAGRTLVDLADAPRPDPDVEAPVRLLPEYDNVLLSHADRSRVGPDADRRRFATRVDERGLGTVLVDGQVAGAWLVADDAVVVRHGRLPRGAVAAVEAEAVALAAFLRTAIPRLADDVRLLEV